MSDFDFDRYTGLVSRAVIKRPAEVSERERERATLREMTGKPATTTSVAHGESCAYEEEKISVDAETWREWAFIPRIESVETFAKLGPPCVGEMVGLLLPEGLAAPRVGDEVRVRLVGR